MFVETEDNVKLLKADGQTSIVNAAGEQGAEFIQQLYSSKHPFYIQNYHKKYNVKSNTGDCIPAATNAYHLVLLSGIKCIPKLIGAKMMTYDPVITHAYVQISFQDKPSMILDVANTHSDRPAKLRFEENYYEASKPEHIQVVTRSQFMDAYRKAQSRWETKSPDHLQISLKMMLKTWKATPDSSDPNFHFGAQQPIS